MGTAIHSEEEDRGKYKVSILVLHHGEGWVTEVAVRRNGRLTTYRRDEQTFYPTKDEARLAGYQWAEDYLRAQGTPKLGTSPDSTFSPA